LQQWRLSIIIISKKQVFASSSKYQMNDAACEIFNCSNPKKERNLYSSNKDQISAIPETFMLQVPKCFCQALSLKQVLFKRSTCKFDLQHARMTLASLSDCNDETQNLSYKSTCLFPLEPRCGDATVMKFTASSPCIVPLLLSLKLCGAFSDIWSGAL
jgi:uncharacterized protein YcgL (UPF0745 family)